jgi:hypothetical protein
VLAWASRPDQSREESDQTFGLAVAAMFLVSPITWSHNLLLLLVPLAVVWVGLPPSRWASVPFLAIVAALWTSPAVVWDAFKLGGEATPIDALVILPYECFALLGVLALGLAEIRGLRGRPVTDSEWTRRALGLGAAVMSALWAHFIISIWQKHGLFSYLGADFAIFRSVAMALVNDGPAAMYDLEKITDYIRPLSAYYGPKAPGLTVGPGPYPAVYFLPFVASTWVSPPVGFLIWTLINLTFAVVTARGLASRFKDASWGLIASAVLFFPVTFTIFFGQPTVILMYCLYRAYRDLEEGREFRAGLWGGMLYLKPQYAVILTLVFLLKGRWRTLAGTILAGMGLVLSSLVILGIEGTRNYLEMLKYSMSGFRDVHSLVHPKYMINWRGLLANFLPLDASEEQGLFLTTILSALTACTLPLIWRGKWDPCDGRFARRFLATMIVTMLASFHNHIHGAALLLVPGMALAAQRGGPRPLFALSLIGLYAPLVVFMTTSWIITAWLLIALMVVALVVIVGAELAPTWLFYGRDSVGSAPSSIPMAGKEYTDYPGYQGLLR